MIRSSLIVLIIIIFSAGCLSLKKNERGKPGAYLPGSVELYNEIAHMDSVMFDAFNAHDLEKLKVTFSENLEFYHDLAKHKGGMESNKGDQL